MLGIYAVKRACLAGTVGCVIMLFLPFGVANLVTRTQVKPGNDINPHVVGLTVARYRIIMNNPANCQPKLNLRAC